MKAPVTSSISTIRNHWRLSPQDDKMMTSTVTVLDDAAFNSKFEQLRNQALPPRRVRQLVGELTAILAQLAVKNTPIDEPIAVLVVLRSGMSMMDEFVAAFPEEANIAVYHLGIFRDRQTLMPVEYYNKLGPRSANLRTGYILDPLLATGGTAEAAITIARYYCPSEPPAGCSSADSHLGTGDLRKSRSCRSSGVKLGCPV